MREVIERDVAKRVVGLTSVFFLISINRMSSEVVGHGSTVSGLLVASCLRTDDWLREV